MWARSTENEVEKKSLYFEVCGTENITLTNSSTVHINHSAQDDASHPFELGPLMQRFVSNSTNCPISQFELWERDSSGRDTLFNHSLDRNVTLVGSEPDSVSNKSSLQITI